MSLDNLQVTDAGLKELAPPQEPLTTLDLDQHAGDGRGAEGTRRTQKPHHTQLGLHTQVTDAGLKELAASRTSPHYTWANTQVTDAGLKELAALKNLTTLNLATRR